MLLLAISGSGAHERARGQVELRHESQAQECPFSYNVEHASTTSILHPGPPPDIRIDGPDRLEHHGEFFLISPTPNPTFIAAMFGGAV